MQTLEALLSLLVFVSILTFFFPVENPTHVNESLYSIQLAEDIWRVLYLRQDFQDFPDTTENLENDLVLMGEETNLCIFIDGVYITNCRGGEEKHEIAASITKSLIYDAKPRDFAVSIGN